MSTIRTTYNQATDAGMVLAMFATDPTGDNVTLDENAHRNEVLFYNGYTAAIVITLVCQSTTPRHIPGVGTVTPANKTLSVPAAGFGVFGIMSEDLVDYLDAAGHVEFTYATGSALMVAAVLAHP